MLFVPGHISRMIEKAAGAGADCVVLDLEDAVPPASKNEARKIIRLVLQDGRFDRQAVMVRVNSFDTGRTAEDVASVACAELDGFVYAMSRNRGEIHAMSRLLSEQEKALGLPAGHFALIPLIETAEGVLNAAEIAAASSRVVALLFGGEDYLAEMSGTHDDDQLCFLWPRVQVIAAARAAGVEPIDTPHVDVHDSEGLAAHLRRGRQLGMDGVLVMSPRQIPAAHEVYTPSQAAVGEARCILVKLEEMRGAGRGLMIEEGVYVSPVAEKKALTLLARVEALEQMATGQTKRGG